MLRDDPKLNNKQLAKALGVNRDTIALDRKVLMDEVKEKSLTEVEQLRADMVEKFVALEAEVQKHRKDGKLSLAAVDRLLDISRAIIDLTGIRKPVVDKKEFTHIEFPTFNVYHGPKPKPPIAEVLEPKQLEGHHD
jgi:hypothetical protein